MTSGSSVGRRPMGFFGPFNKWWSKFFLDHGRRPSKTDIEAWRADNMSWRPELTVEDIVQHSKGRRDPEKNRQYFVEYRRKMKAAAKKPTRRASRRRRRSGGAAAAARDVDLDEEDEELAEGAEEEEDEEVQGPGQAAEGAAAQLEAEGPMASHAEEAAAAAERSEQGGSVLSALPTRAPGAAGVEALRGCAPEPPALRVPAERGKCSSIGAGASSSSVPSASEGDSILPNGPAAAVISAAAASAAAAAATLDATDSAADEAVYWPGGQLEPRSAQLSCHASPLHGDMLAGAGSLPSHFAAVAASRAASSALPAVHLPEVALPPSAAAAMHGAVSLGLAPRGAHSLVGLVTQIAMRRTRGPSTSALLRRGSAAPVCGGGAGGISGGLSHQGSISVTSAAASDAPLPPDTLLGLLGPADFGGAWGCCGLGPSSWAADWDSHSGWPAEVDAAAAAPLAGCGAATAACGGGVPTWADLGSSSSCGDGSAVDMARVGSSAGPLELAKFATAPILPPLSPEAACAAAAAAASAAAAKPPATSASAIPLDPARLMCGSMKRPLDLAHAPSATSLTALAEVQGGSEEPLAKQRRQEIRMQRRLEQRQLQHQPSEVLVSSDVCGEGSSTSISAPGIEAATKGLQRTSWPFAHNHQQPHARNGPSNGSGITHCQLHLHCDMRLLPQLSPAPCEPAPALPAGLSGAAGSAGAAGCGHYASAGLPACGVAGNGLLVHQGQAASTLPALPLSIASGSELQRGVSPTLPAEPAPCPMPAFFMMNGYGCTYDAPSVLMRSSGLVAATASEVTQEHGRGPGTSLWECEGAEEQAQLCRGVAPAAFAFGAAPAAAAEAAARAADEEAGADALGWLDSVLIDPEAFDAIACASPRAAAGPVQRACLSSPFLSRQPPEQHEQQLLLQGHGAGAGAGASSCGGDQHVDGGDGILLCSDGLLSLSSGGCGNSSGVFILV